MSLVPDHIAAIKPYVPGKPMAELERELGLTSTIKLASNENPLGPSPKVKRALRASLPEINHYPDGSAYELTRALAARLEVTPEAILLGNGSNELIDIATDARMSVVRESATSAQLDVDNGFGVVAMRRATDLALSKARTHDLGMVTLRNSSHTGRFGEYVVRIAEAGFMGLVFGTGAKPGGTVAPYLGISPSFNSYPIAWGVPASQHPPVFIDYATSACAVGKLVLAADKGVPVPEGWLMDPDGNPSTDPMDSAEGRCAAALWRIHLVEGWRLAAIRNMLPAR